MNDLCKQRTNSLKVSVVKGSWDRMEFEAEAVMRAIGPEFGKEGPKVKAAIEGADAAELKKGILEDGFYETDGFRITEKHVVFNEKLPENVFSAEMQGGVVCVDVTLTNEIEAEGFSREIIRRIQEMRRQLDLKVEEYITAGVAIDDDRIAMLVSGGWKDGIMNEVRAKEMVFEEGTLSGDFDLVQDWDVEGIKIKIGISGNN